MSVQLINGFVFVPMEIDVFQEVLRRYGNRANGVIQQVTEDFLERTADDDFHMERHSIGIFWEKVFLPDGSRLRTKKRGEDYQYADVSGEKIIFDAQPYPSVSKAVNRMRDVKGCNAWRVVEVMRPQDTQWVQAELLRKGLA